MLVEPVEAVRGLVKGALWSNQQMRPFQYGKQGIASELDPALGQWGLNQAVQLARAYPRLAATDLRYLVDYLAIPLMEERFGLALLVIGLPGQADETAGFGETQAGYRFLLDDSPEGFFGSLTPYSLRMTSSMASNNAAF